RNVEGVKESSGDLNQIATLVRDRDPGFTVWSGDDYLFLPSLAIGADGVVGVASHLCSREYRLLFDAYRGGDVAKAAHIHASLLGLMNALFVTSNPIPVKWAMNQLGFKAGVCRPPLDAMPQFAIDALAPQLAPFRTSVTA
ncbi:MAG TPA: dihydrodipicolinate synthase family protein, partial [Candidatus Baltobacteraceae bacterium]|nr:dihydrodipicolinate synthase family protein [Candidatus Baltobacteraceae bacterium]